MAGFPAGLTEGHVLIATHTAAKRSFHTHLLLQPILHVTSLLSEHKINQRSIAAAENRAGQ